MFKHMAVVHEGSALGRMIETDEKLYGLLHKHSVARPLIKNIGLTYSATIWVRGQRLSG